ncbi:MAG: C13 family peptidase [Caldilineaceae bacterium]
MVANAIQFCGKLILCLCVGLLLAVGSAQAQGEPSGSARPTVVQGNADNVRLVGQIGGLTRAVYVTDGIAYMGEGPRLTLLSVAQPSQPVVVGKTAPLPETVTGIFVNHQIAYVTASSAGLYLFDVSDPTMPLLIGYFDTPGHAYGISVAGQYAYVADGGSGLRVVDVSDPAAPTEIGALITPRDAQDVQVVGQIAYVTDSWSGSGLRVVDVSNPAAPTEVGALNTRGAEGIHVVGQVAYVANGRNELRIADVSNPAAPMQIGALNTTGTAYDVYVAGQYAYIANGSRGLYVVDVANPALPTAVGAYDLLSDASSIYLAGQYAYIANGSSGLSIVDVSNPVTPTRIGIFATPSEAQGIHQTGQVAYVADGENGLRVVDLANPTRPTLVGALDTPGYAEDVYVAWEYAYVADGAAGLRVVDVTQPSAPTEVGVFDTPGYAESVSIDGAYLYIADGQSGLRVLSWLNPVAPNEIGALVTPGYAADVHVVGLTAYIAAGNAGLRVVDLLNRSTPREIGAVDMSGYASGVHVVGQIAYVADGSNGLRIINVANPATPMEIGFFTTLGAVRSVYVAGQFAYIADDYTGLRIVDVTNPAAPTAVGSFSTPDYATQVFVDDQAAYVTTGSTGLYLLKYPACYRLQQRFTGLGSAPVTTPTNSNGCPTGEYLFGTSLTFQATPAAGWRVASWAGTLNDSSISPINQLTMPAADHMVTVNYLPICYPLTLTHSGSGEEPRATPPNSAGCAFGQYIGGETVMLEATPGTGFVVAGWRGANHDSSTAISNTLTMPTTPYSAGVIYKPACYALTLTHTGSGSNPSPTPPQSGECATGYYHYNESVILSANPATGWQISAWSGTVNNAATTPANTVLMPPADHIAIVHYGEVPMAGEGDAYEADSSCTRSRSITTDGSEVQVHTFHTAEDRDWIRFDAVAGTRYRVEVVVPDGSNADVALESYRDCESAPSEQASPTFSVGARLDISRTVSGPTYIRLVPVRSEQTGANALYHVSVRNLGAPPPNRALIIAAGRLKMNDLVQPNIDHVADRVYRLFQSKGYTDDNIFLLTTDAGQALRDAPATKTNLKTAITEWAASRVANGVLTLYMVDHGSEEKFYLDNVNQEVVTPAELDEWLSTLEDQVAGVKINVIIEACQSGSFISPAGGSISSNGRVIITSSNQTEDAYASAEGAYFSDHLLSWLQQDYSIRKSFEEAGAAAKTIHGLQEAWLDANGDGLVNKEEDFRLAAQRGFAFPGTLPGDEWAPEFFAVEQVAPVNEGRVRVRVDVRDDKTVRQVWVVVYPPDYTPPPAGAELRPEVLHTVLFTRIDNDNHWEAEIVGLQQPGAYRLIVHAEDGVGMVARPMMLTVNTASQHPVYLPLIHR